MSLLHTCSTPPNSLPSTWEDETLDLYKAFRESNNPISITVASAFDIVVKLAKAGGGGTIEDTTYSLATESGDFITTETGQKINFQ